MHFRGRRLLLGCFKGDSGHTPVVRKGAVELQAATVTAAVPCSGHWPLGSGQLSAGPAEGIPHPGARRRTWPEPNLAILGRV